MKNILVISALAIGVFFSSNAMAVHTCGQLLGSCLPHLGPTPIITPKPAPEPAKPIIIIKPARPVKN